MRLEEKAPVTVNGNIGQSSVTLADVPSVPQVSMLLRFVALA